MPRDDGNPTLSEIIVDTVSDALVLWRDGGEIIFLSPSAELLFGHRQQDVAGRPLKILLGPDLHPRYDRELARWRELDERSERVVEGRGDHDGPTAGARGRGRPLLLQCQRADGSVFPAELVKSEHLSAEGERLFVGAFRDVSDRFLAVEAQRRSESLRLLIEGLPDAVMVHRDERLVYVNRAFLDRLDYTSPDALLGRSLHELLHPDDVEGVRQRIAELRQTRKPTKPREERFRTRGGNTVTLEVAKVPVEFDGAPAVVAIGRDVSERKLAEERFRIAVESAPCGMVMIDREGRIVLANREVEHLFGYDAGELVGRSLEILVPERFRAEHPRQRERFLADPRARAMGAGRDLYGLHKDGSELPVEIGLNPIRTPEGALVLASIVDISERRHSEMLLAAADRMRAVGTLAAGVAHGINNPLAFVKGNILYVREELESVREQPGGPSERPFGPETLREAEEALAQAQEGADRIRDIVADLLTFTRKESSDGEPVDCHRVLESVINMTRNEIWPRARLIRRFGETPLVSGDESQIAHAVTNLVLNATQALPEGEAERHEIRLSTRSERPGRVIIEIEDTGPGIPTELRSSIFDPFFTTKPVGRGTGLGLSVSHAIVSAIGGRIEVDSGPEGGACFRVFLRAAERTAPHVPTCRPPTDTKARVLIVDDEPHILDMMRRMLRGHTHLTMARGGLEVLERVRAGEHFDAILCDLLMSEMNGMQLYEALQSEAPELVSRMLFVTGGAFTEDTRAFLDRVPNPVLVKPAERDEVLEALVSIGAVPQAREEPAKPRESS
jgi:PAS domain S-box-containing protein